MIQSIRAEIAPNEHGHVFLVFDTFHDQKHVYTACGVGHMDRGQPMISEIANGTLAALANYSSKSGTFMMVEIATEAAAPMRVRKALESAKAEDAVFFICRSSQVYDAAVISLNVNMHSGSGSPVQ